MCIRDRGNPWIFNQINHYLKYGQALALPSMSECFHVMSDHLSALHKFYGEVGGVRISRKHIGWYINPLPGGREFTRVFNTLETTEEQRRSLRNFFIGCSDQEQVA